MEELYSKKIKSTSGPSDLTIKRILAFSKALDSSKVNIEEENKEIEKE